MKSLATFVKSNTTAALRNTSVLSLLALISLAACSCAGTQQGKLEIVSTTNPNLRLEPQFRTVLYKQKSPNASVIILSDLEPADLISGNYTNASILVIDMFLRPKAGSTPIEGTATNATIRHIILVGDETVGIYGGGGFLYPTSKASKDHFSGNIFNATLKLIRNSEGFADRMQNLEIKGKLNAQRADQTVSQIAFAVNTEVSRRLRQVYFVIPD